MGDSITERGELGTGIGHWGTVVFAEIVGGIFSDGLGVNSVGYGKLSLGNAFSGRCVVFETGMPLIFFLRQ